MYAICTTLPKEGVSKGILRETNRSRSTERWPSGLRRTPAKRVYPKRVPRVQIPLSPPNLFCKNINFARRRIVSSKKKCGKLVELSAFFGPANVDAYRAGHRRQGDPEIPVLITNWAIIFLLTAVPSHSSFCRGTKTLPSPSGERPSY